MIQRMLTSALAAGGAAGLLAALLHFAFIQDDILLAEGYETGALVHFQGVAALPQDHSQAADETAHDEPAVEAEGEVSALQRNGLTLLFQIVKSVAFGLLLVAGFALVENFGRRIGAREGLLWGLAGYAALQIAPALGLPPELPGTLAADLGARQLWWAGTVLATAAGLGLLAYGRSALTLGFAALLLAAPHLIGAPELERFFGTAPPELSGRFVARVLGTALPVWALLGWLAGRLWESGRA